MPLICLLSLVSIKAIFLSALQLESLDQDGALWLMLGSFPWLWVYDVLYSQPGVTDEHGGPNYVLLLLCFALETCPCTRASCAWLFRNVQPLQSQLDFQRWRMFAWTRSKYLPRRCGSGDGCLKTSFLQASLLWKRLSEPLDNIALKLPCLRWSQDLQNLAQLYPMHTSQNEFGDQGLD